MEEISVPKQEGRKLVVYTKSERWAKFFGVFVAGAMGLFGYQKMPMVNQGTKISEAVSVVKNLNPEELTALQGLQVNSLERKIDATTQAQLIAIAGLKAEMKEILKEYDDRTTKTLDRHSDQIMTNVKAVARLEALAMKSNRL